METQKITNLLGDESNESWKFATRKQYVTNDQNKTDHGEGNEIGTTIKFETQVIKSNLCDYSDAYILVTGDITATGSNENTKVAFKNCAPFTKWITHINNEHTDDADTIWLNTVIIIQILQEVYGSLKETSKIWTMVIFMLVLIQLIQHLLNINQIL